MSLQVKLIAAWRSWLLRAAFSIGSLGTFSAAEAVPQTLSSETQAFLVRHCHACHANREKEGGLDLGKLTGDMSTRLLTDRWTHIYDRVALGEMPPEAKSGPTANERKDFLKWIEPRLKAADQQRRETVQRRLNREEYQNTIRDLLGIDIDVKPLLPKDQQSGGFDNNGEALAISTELMGQYLQAAELAIDAAIVHGEQPPSVSFTVDSKKEVEPYIPKQFGLIDDRIVAYTRNDTQYSKISTRAKRIPLKGRYRFRLQVAAVNNAEPLVFNVVASDFANVGAIYKNLGYFEAEAKPKTIELEVVLDKGFAIQFFPLGLPTWLKDPSTGEHPGIGFGPVEITGPLHVQWPPESHRKLLGDIDLARGILADAEPILRRLATGAFRRPLPEGELKRYAALVRGRMEAGRSFEQSLRAGLTAILCSPNFLYLREDVNEGRNKITDHELATRLSYFLWSSLPDAELLQLAEQKTLHQPDILRAQVERMLQAPQRERMITNFTGQWLRLREIDATMPDAKLYPEFDELLKVSMVGEGEGFFRTLLEADLNINNFLNSDFALLNGRLAQHYGIEGISGFAMRKVPLPAGSVRGGVLTQAGVLKVTANGTNTSPVTRGMWVLENIIGQTVPPPPANVAGIEPDIRGATTIREQLAKHRDNESCNVCHRQIDPPGFALESFDPIGRYREHYLRFFVNPQFADKGWGKVGPAGKVDPSGSVVGGASFTDIREFKQLLLKQQDRFARCLTEKILTYALGRELGFSDRDQVEAIVSNATSKGNGLRTLIHEIVQSPAFSTK